MRVSVRRAISIILWLTFTCSGMFATGLTFVGSSGSREASLNFTMVGGQLWITLRNTYGADALVPADMLGGVFFNIENNPVLTPVWAKVDAGSCLLYPSDPGCTPAGGSNVGGEWAYHMYGTGSPIGQHYGISAVGFGFVSPSDRFDVSQNISGPSAVGGGDFSLAPAGDNPATANGGLLNNEPYVRSAVQFAFTPPAGFNLATAAISNIRFQYGTSFCEPWIPGTPEVPEPATLGLIGGGLIALSLARRRFAR